MKYITIEDKACFVFSNYEINNDPGHSDFIDISNMTIVCPICFQILSLLPDGTEGCGSCGYLI